MVSFCTGGQDFFIFLSLIVLTHCISIFFLNPFCCVKLGQDFLFFIIFCSGDVITVSADCGRCPALSLSSPHQPASNLLISSVAPSSSPLVCPLSLLPWQQTDTYACDRFPWRRDREGFQPPSFTITCECKIKFIWKQNRPVCCPAWVLAFCCRSLVNQCCWFKLKYKQMLFFIPQ